jgi:hypothetical protein
MKHLLLNDLYDSVNKVAPTFMWIFLLLMAIEWLYVMFKYLGGAPDGRDSAAK